MFYLSVVAVIIVGGWVGGGFPLRQLTLATKQIANIACLAFSGGNKPIDF